MDTVGVERPALQVLAEHGEFARTGEDAVKAGAAPDVAWFEAEKAITIGGWRNLHERAQPGYTVQISGASHVSFMDVPFLPVTEASVVKPALDAMRSNRSGCGGSLATCCSRSLPGTSTVQQRRCSTEPRTTIPNSSLPYPDIHRLS